MLPSPRWERILIHWGLSWLAVYRVLPQEHVVDPGVDVGLVLPRNRIATWDRPIIDRRLTGRAVDGVLAE